MASLISSADEKHPSTTIDDEKSPAAVEVKTSNRFSVDNIDGASDIYDSAERDDAIIRTGADASAYLLPLRDDGDPALTFRSIFLATGLAAFQATMTQIYNVMHATLSGKRIHRLTHLCSGNPPWSPSRARSLSSLPISLAMAGLFSYLAVTNSWRAGDQSTARRRRRSGFRS